MVRGTSLAAAVLLLGGAAAAAPLARVTERPPAGYTGGFGEPTCVECHTGNALNAFGGFVRIEGVPEAFDPGESYALTVLLQAEETAVAGFQLTARYVSGAFEGRSAGALIPMDDRVEVTDSAGVSYVHHNREGSRTPSSDGTSWSMTWTAPETGGEIVFHVAANSGNGDDSPLGDLVFVHRELVAAVDRSPTR